MTSDRVPAEDIVRVLATEKPPLDSEWYTCSLCNAELRDAWEHDQLDDVTAHYADCPWRLAREWVDGS